jgi:predicted nucleotidyltransferase
MGAMQLPQDFKDFLKLLNDHEVEYLLLGGYAVAYHGFPRTTLDMDIWIANTIENAEKMIRVMRAFGFTGKISPRLFRTDDSVVRMGVPPMKIEVMTHASGVTFSESFQRKVVDTIDDVQVNVISLEDLRSNKAAAGRYKDLDDLEHLPS